MERPCYQLPMVAVLSMIMLSCSTTNSSDNRPVTFTPSEVIDLGALVTEDLPERFWGKGFVKQ